MSTYGSLYLVMANKIKTALFLEPKQVAELKAIQKEIGVPISESIRRAINEYLEKRKKK